MNKKAVSKDFQRYKNKLNKKGNKFIKQNYKHYNSRLQLAGRYGLHFKFVSQTTLKWVRQFEKFQMYLSLVFNNLLDNIP